MKQPAVGQFFWHAARGFFSASPRRLPRTKGYRFTAIFPGFIAAGMASGGEALRLVR
jgi:hypothetical protein